MAGVRQEPQGVDQPCLCANRQRRQYLGTGDSYLSVPVWGGSEEVKTYGTTTFDNQWEPWREVSDVAKNEELFQSVMGRRRTVSELVYQVVNGDEVRISYPVRRALDYWAKKRPQTIYLVHDGKLKMADWRKIRNWPVVHSMSHGEYVTVNFDEVRDAIQA